MGDQNGNIGGDTQPSLGDRLRITLNAARGNLEIRAQLRKLVADPARFGPIVEELGARHALVRELLTITRHGEAESAA